MWRPLDESELTQMIEEAERDMSIGCKRFWDYIKVKPKRWSLSPEGDEGGGFWVVALMGSTCIYYNDIEEGFNSSSYESFGEISDYYCDDLDLLLTIENFYRQFLRDVRAEA